LYSSPRVIRIIELRRIKWAGHMARMRMQRYAYRALVRTPGERRPLRIYRHRRENESWKNGMW
jgi:hypothetical protein